MEDAEFRRVVGLPSDSCPRNTYLDVVVTSWIADSFNVNTSAAINALVDLSSDIFGFYRWMIVSSMIELGLSWWQAWICVWIGYGFVAPFLVANARPGAVFHVTFPVVARTSFGIWGSMWCVFNRAVMAW